MTLSNYHIAYFLGIGGIGMSALARWFNAHGLRVSGYDRTASALTDALEAEGIRVHFEDHPDRIPQEVKDQKDKTLVVYTPAVPGDHLELNFLRENGYAIYKRSEVLGALTEGHPTVAVAGTHGKTTTSTMISHLLYDSGHPTAAFMGGISQNYSSNLLLSRDEELPYTIVVEADEFDRSFLTLVPNIAVITSTDADHLDIYGDHEHMKEAFLQFAGRVNSQGRILLGPGASALKGRTGWVHTETYGREDDLIRPENIRPEGRRCLFDVQVYDRQIKDLELYMPGFHNVENATAAIAVALELGVQEEAIRSAIRSFRGIKRRFEYIVNEDKVVYIDDYAHHPGEITALLRSVRALYPGKKVTAIFQPHLYSRTRDFASGFSHSLSLADEVLLMDIYPAREKPIPGVSSDMLMEGITAPEKKRVSAGDLKGALANASGVVLTIGAGDIDRLVPVIRECLTEGIDEAQ
ncbi:UDP-N-acetylmuramate--L-alanine ligase [Roseivirga sp. BDSF3-8]|uniref:UDP-N-acetylmuramate--L-alanine ligase n=1 Tax=Roseivirga sp. BDSF3-8 TaxID=3241598 RepID=UPI0035325739